MIIITPISQEDYEGWLPLWNANNQGQVSEAVTAETWRRLINPNHPVGGMVARQEDAGGKQQIVGLVHYVIHPTTGHIKDVCYMQDVFVDPHQRQKGIARQLVTALSIKAKKEGWARLYWLAESNNRAAQELYKNLGLKLNFTFHVMPL